MDLNQALKEVSELEERFLEADEMLDELPNPEAPDDDSDMSEAEHVLEAAMHGVESLHGLLLILKRPTHQSALMNILSQDQIDVLKETEECLGKLITSMGGGEEEEEEGSEEETPEEEAGEEEEEEEEEKEGEESTPLENPEEAPEEEEEEEAE
jgi:hypothetical protein